jgi:hypothetical protein
MISSNCDINEFMESVGACDEQELIVLANQEAVEAERIGLHPEKAAKKRENCWNHYAGQLKALISYVRYEVRPKSLVHQFENFSWTTHR